RADDAGRQDHPDLRGHQPDPASGDGPPAPPLTRDRDGGRVGRRPGRQPLRSPRGQAHPALLHIDLPDPDGDPVAAAQPGGALPVRQQAHHAGDHLHERAERYDGGHHPVVPAEVAPGGLAVGGTVVIVSHCCVTSSPRALAGTGGGASAGPAAGPGRSTIGLNLRLRARAALWTVQFSHAAHATRAAPPAELSPTTRRASGPALAASRRTRAGYGSGRCGFEPCRGRACPVWACAFCSRMPRSLDLTGAATVMLTT